MVNDRKPFYPVVILVLKALIVLNILRLSKRKFTSLYSYQTVDPCIQLKYFLHLIYKSKYFVISASQSISA